MKMFKNSFWGILKKGYWDSENTDEVFEPIINFLVNHKDQYIFDFHDLMSEFLYELDRELKCPQLLTLPAKAWSIKNNKSIEKYPHTPKYNIQTKSNTKYW